MTPQQAYEKRYAHIDNGQHTWEAAPQHVKDMWLAAWTIAWAIAESTEREACAKVCEENADCCNLESVLFEVLSSSAAAIRARSST